MSTLSGLKVHNATFLRAVNKQKNRVLDTGANMTLICTLKPRVYSSIC